MIDPSRPMALAALTLTVALAGTIACAADLKVFSVDAFGGKPNERADSAPALRAAIAKAIAAGGGKVVFGPGKYYMMTPGERRVYAAWPMDARNVHVSGVKGKTEIIMTSPRIGFLRFDRSEDCSLRHVICDYETPPFTQGKVTAVDKGASSFEMVLDEGFPTPDEPFFEQGAEWGMPMHATEPRPRHVWLDHTWIRAWENVSGRTWRLTCRNRNDINSIAAGDRFVLLARQKNPTIFGLWNCRRIVMEDIVVHASPGITNGVVMCDAITYRRFQVRFREGTNRVITSNGDGIHVHGNRKGPLIEDCYFEGICDDGVNLNSHMSPITAVEGRTILVEPGPVAFQEGDRLQVFDPDTGRLRATVKAAAVKFLRDQGRYELVLAEAVPGIKVNAPATPRPDARPGRGRGPTRTGGDVVYNLDSANAGYVIRGNTFFGHRRHGLLIRSGDGVIENNTFDHICGNAVSIEDGAPLEGPIPFDIIVRKNRIVAASRSFNHGKSGRDGAIMVLTTAGGRKIAPGRAARNISILDNEIVDPPRYAIYVGSATDVKIVGNRVTATAETPDYGANAAVCVENAAGVVIKDLTFTDPRQTVQAGVLIRGSVDGGAKGVTIEGLKVNIREGAPAVLDEREAK